MLAGSAAASDRPVWWEDFQKRASRDGYRLITGAELDELMDQEENMLLLDVRPEYEYQAGSLPGAEHLEFHEGHRNGLEPERAEEFFRMAGPDKSRTVVVYCRSFR
jgi:rhodanese-related sulfurtransferase